MRSVLVTGVSSGIGYAIADSLLTQNDRVTGVSRRQPKELIECGLVHWSLDLSDSNAVDSGLSERLLAAPAWTHVILNAGIIGSVSDLSSCEDAILQHVFQINVWSNKALLDQILRAVPTVRQVVAMTSGAGQEGKRGLGAYCLSKATLNMLIQLYAREFPHVHFTSLLPGTVATPMQDLLCSVEDDRFPILDTLRERRALDSMSNVDSVARRLIAQLDQFPELVASGNTLHLDALSAHQAV
jgi:NAD(P)-dependent dehydrogenase (short-subunit alcohol dehydrogenase family)